MNVVIGTEYKSYKYYYHKLNSYQKNFFWSKYMGSRNVSALDFDKFITAINATHFIALMCRKCA